MEIYPDEAREIRRLVRWLGLLFFRLFYASLVLYMLPEIDYEWNTRANTS